MVPSQKIVSARASSTTGPSARPDAGRDDALHAVDLVLLHQLAEALDRVLGRGLFLDHQLDLAAGDAAGGVEALDRPLRGADAALARAAAMPERGARMPMRTGLPCAIAGQTTLRREARRPRPRISRTCDAKAVMDSLP